MRTYSLPPASRSQASPSPLTHLSAVPLPKRSAAVLACAGGEMQHTAAVLRTARRPRGRAVGVPSTISVPIAAAAAIATMNGDEEQN
eukprot:scaffold19984_cov127-Isochrysis_galbana.AAC.7